MTNYNEAQDNLVEVNINLDCFCYIPEVLKDGTLKFVKAFPAWNRSITLIQVKVPSEVVCSQEALTDYFNQKQEGYEFVSFDDINILDTDPSDDLKGGK